MPLNTIVERISTAIGCDTSFAVLPVLAMLASTIGNTRRLVIKQGWNVPAIIWAVVIGESGSQKTPAFKAVMKPLRNRQRKAMELYEEANKQHENECAHYEVAFAEWKKTQSINEPPCKPEPPTATRCLVENTTVEALAPILLTNPRQPMLAKDELSGWFGSFDRYSNGKGADESFWLSAFCAESHIVDRKTAAKPTIYIPEVCMSVTGGIQPAILQKKPLQRL